MEQFDSSKQFNNILNEFKRTDEFYNSFRHQFIITLFLIVKKYNKSLKLDVEMDKIIRLYADEMLSCVESVLYKDKSYPEYRLKEEVEMLARIIDKKPEKGQSAEFIEKSHLAAKEMLVYHYPDIYDLSAEAFRLLEKYSRMYSWEFITNFYSYKEKSQN